MTNFYWLRKRNSQHPQTSFQNDIQLLGVLICSYGSTFSSMASSVSCWKLGTSEVAVFIYYISIMVSSSLASSILLAELICVCIAKDVLLQRTKCHKYQDKPNIKRKTMSDSALGDSLLAVSQSLLAILHTKSSDDKNQFLMGCCQSHLVQYMKITRLSCLGLLCLHDSSLLSFEFLGKKHILEFIFYLNECSFSFIIKNTQIVVRSVIKLADMGK